MQSKKVKSDLLGSFFWHSFYFKFRIYRVLNNLIRFFCYIRGVKIGDKVFFAGFPVIRRYPNSTISLGHNGYFNSSKNSVLIGLQQPCKFITLKENSMIIIGNDVGASGVIIVADSKVEIGNKVMIGANSIIFDTDFHHSDPNVRLRNDSMPSRPVIIEDNVYIGSNCLILKGVTIGQNSVIGANSVVISNIPKNSIAMGNPCKIIIRKNWDSK